MESTPLNKPLESDNSPSSINNRPSYTTGTSTTKACYNGVGACRERPDNGVSHYNGASNNNSNQNTLSRENDTVGTSSGGPPREGEVEGDVEGGVEGEKKEGEKDGKKKISFSKIPNRSKYVLVLCCFAQMCSAVAFAVIAPFYPQEADKKGVSSAQVGLVFSVFELVNFTTSPFIGNYLTRIGTKFVFVSGIFVAGTSSIIFGTLDNIQVGTTFFAMSLVCRAFIALGFCSFTVANFAIVSSEFPSSVATVFGVLETMTGIGLMAGPLVGSALYELGGFCAPFYSLGALVLVSDVLIYFLLPETKGTSSPSSLSMTSFAKVPLVLLSMANITITSIGISFMESTLSRHLEERFKLSVAVIGTFFIVAPATYGISMPLWSFLVDKKNIKFPVIITGLASSFVGYLLVAPCPWPGIIPQDMWILIVGLFVLGISYGPIFIGATKCLVNAILEKGYKDDLNTFAVVSGLFYFSYSFGAFAGPFIGGFLSQHLGYANSYSILALLHLPNILCSTVFSIVRHKRRKHQTEEDTLGIASNDHNAICYDSIQEQDGTSNGAPSDIY